MKAKNTPTPTGQEEGDPFIFVIVYLYYFRHWVNSVSDIYGPDEIEELLEDLNRLEMASFDGIMMFDNDPVPPDHHDLSMRPTSSEMNIMRDGEAVISGCITQLPDDDLEDFDIDGSHVSIPMQQNNMNKVQELFRT